MPAGGRRIDTSNRQQHIQSPTYPAFARDACQAMVLQASAHISVLLAYIPSTATPLDALVSTDYTLRSCGNSH